MSCYLTKLSWSTHSSPHICPPSLLRTSSVLHHSNTPWMKRRFIIFAEMIHEITDETAVGKNRVLQSFPFLRGEKDKGMLHKYAFMLSDNAWVHKGVINRSSSSLCTQPQAPWEPRLFPLDDIEEAYLLSEAEVPSGWREVSSVSCSSTHSSTPLSSSVSLWYTALSWTNEELHVQ